MDKIPEIENAILSMTVQEQAVSGTPLGYKNVYKDIKFRELTAAQNADPNNEEPALISSIESGAGVSTGVKPGDATAAEKRKRAMNASALHDIREGRQDDPLEAWADVINDM